jgi:Protein of unknown function (DUF1176)
MKNKTRIYIISGVLILGLFGLLFIINLIAGQKNNKKPVKPISSTDDVALTQAPTTEVNINRSISVSKTTKINSLSSTKSSSSISNSSSSNSSSENSSSSQVSSSSVNADPELDSRLQWKEDCRLLSSFSDNGQKPQVTNLGDGKQLVITNCNNGAYQGQSLIYYYEVAPNGRWLSQRQTFWNNISYLNLPTLNTTNLTDFDKFRGIGDCGRISKYEFNLNTKIFDPIKIQEQDCVPIEQNPSAIKDAFGEVISIDQNLWPIIYERK